MTYEQGSFGPPVGSNPRCHRRDDRLVHAGGTGGDRWYRYRATIKGVIAGILIGVFARKVHSLMLGIVFGLGVGLLLAFIVAQVQHGYYFQIMLPGGMVGLIVGYATQRYGRGPKLQQT
jgi:hypothetical protein